ncbi:MAG: L-seryl-tRNA(Sec) selenium transferase [Bacillota bacterium]
MEEYLRQIPSVDQILANESIENLSKRYSHQVVVDIIREVIDELRQQILAGEISEDFAISTERIVKQVIKRTDEWINPNLKAVINGTGVVLHTNLGRSLLSQSAQERILEVANNYSTLEFDIEAGERGSRYDHLHELLIYLTGAEDCLVVNNNAGAVLLALSTLAQDKEVIISRSQLVEIGGSFRIPEVMEQSGAQLVEVGATNKTHLSDYQAAITEDTGLLLQVHTSNYRIIGFSKQVGLEELVELGGQEDIPVLSDLGSGTLVDFTEYGFSPEPTVQEEIAKGADVVTFSGDKLLGGPQAGIIVGKQKYIEQIKEHPLNRALRVDKFTLAGLEETLRAYLDPQTLLERVPTLRLLTLDSEELKAAAEKLAHGLTKLAGITVEVAKGYSQVGGGAFPTEKLPTYLVKVSSDLLSAHELNQRLRYLEPPLLTYIQDEEVIIDPRTVKEEELEMIIAHFTTVLEEE